MGMSVNVCINLQVEQRVIINDICDFFKANWEDLLRHAKHESVIIFKFLNRSYPN